MSVVELCLRRIREVLSLDEDFGQLCRSPEDLCRLLVDGETLCCILCVLSDGSLSLDGDCTVSFYSQNSQLLARRNVNFFLDKCVDHFGLRRNVLFEPDDLLELQRPERVLAGLQELLQVAKEPQATGASMLPNVIKEICSAEHQLAVKLETLLHFRRELIDGPLSEWSPDLVDLAFRHHDELLRLHEAFHQRLVRLAETGAEEFCTGLDGLFRATKLQLEIYSEYYAHYPLAKAQLEEAFSANPQLRRQLQQLEHHFRAGSFSVLYDAPLRQVFNYSMLFERLLNAASKEAPVTVAAATSVEAALVECKRLLVHFNERKRSSEKAAATLLLLQKVGRLPQRLARLEDVGLHRADGAFRVKRNQEPVRDCFCLLTDRQLIVANKVRGGVMEFLFNAPITDDLWLEYLSVDSLKLQQASAGTVLFKRKASGMDVQLWGLLLTQARAFNHPDGWNTSGHCFRLQSFPSGSACSRCHETLTGYAFQGYHCRHCNLQLDRECLKFVVRMQRPQSYPGEIQQQQKASDYEFFHRDLDRRAAQRLLERHPDGAFLIRENADRTTLVLSIKWTGAKVFHLIVQQREEGSTGSILYSVGSCKVWKASLDSLVDHFRANKLNINDGVTVTLGDGVMAAVYVNY